MKYAEVSEVEAGFRPLDQEEQTRCDALLQEAAIVIDAFNAQADAERKKLVSCRMVRRQLDAGGQGAVTFPTGASQGSASALGYSQTWSMPGGSVGELYLSKLEKQLLGVGSKIGACSPLEGMVTE